MFFKVFLTRAIIREAGILGVTFTRAIIGEGCSYFEGFAHKGDNRGWEGEKLEMLATWFTV